MKASLEGPRGPGCAASALPHAGVWSLGLSPQPRLCPVLPGGEDTWECVRGSLLDPRLSVVLQLSSSVPQKHLGAEWLSRGAPKIPQCCQWQRDGAALPAKTGLGSWVGNLAERKEEGREMCCTVVWHFKQNPDALMCFFLSY